MNPAEQKLVEALRSGRYEQTNGRLKDHRGFCCLGVACDILGAAWEQDSGGTQLARAGEDRRCAYTLPSAIERQLGWSDDNGGLEIVDYDGNQVHLAQLNDTGFTFAQIADVIEAGLVEKRIEEKQ